MYLIIGIKSWHTLFSKPKLIIISSQPLEFQIGKEDISENKKNKKNNPPSHRLHHFPSKV